jgi:hypothetical protein
VNVDGRIGLEFASWDSLSLKIFVASGKVLNGEAGRSGDRTMYGVHCCSHL